MCNTTLLASIMYNLYSQQRTSQQCRSFIQIETEANSGVADFGIWWRRHGAPQWSICENVRRDFLHIFGIIPINDTEKIDTFVQEG